MPRSRLTYKYQATVPKAVREALALRAGDEIEFLVSSLPSGQPEVRVRKGVTAAAAAELGAQTGLLSAEWDAPEDEEAYREL